MERGGGAPPFPPSLQAIPWSRGYRWWLLWTEWHWPWLFAAGVYPGGILPGDGTLCHRGPSWQHYASMWLWDFPRSPQPLIPPRTTPKIPRHARQQLGLFVAVVVVCIAWVSYGRDASLRRPAARLHAVPTALDWRPLTAPRSGVLQRGSIALHGRPQGEQMRVPTSLPERRVWHRPAAPGRRMAPSVLRCERQRESKGRANASTKE